MIATDAVVYDSKLDGNVRFKTYGDVYELVELFSILSALMALFLFTFGNSVTAIIYELFLISVN